MVVEWLRIVDDRGSLAQSPIDPRVATLADSRQSGNQRNRELVADECVVEFCDDTRCVSPVLRLGLGAGACQQRFEPTEGEGLDGIGNGTFCSERPTGLYIGGTAEIGIGNTGHDLEVVERGQLRREEPVECCCRGQPGTTVQMPRGVGLLECTRETGTTHCSLGGVRSHIPGECRDIRRSEEVVDPSAGECGPASNGRDPHLPIGQLLDPQRQPTPPEVTESRLGDG